MSFRTLLVLLVASALAFPGPADAKPKEPASRTESIPILRTQMKPASPPATTAPEEAIEETPATKTPKTASGGRTVRGVGIALPKPATGGAPALPAARPKPGRSSGKEISTTTAPQEGLSGAPPRRGIPGRRGGPATQGSGLPTAGGGLGAPTPPGGLADELAPPGKPLPDPGGRAKIWIDRGFDAVDLVRGQKVSLQWDLSAIQQANGMGLIVRDTQPGGNVCRNPGFNNLTGLAGTAVYRGKTGTASFVPEIPDGNQQIFIVGCVFDRTGGQDVSLDRETNRILAITGERPDLIITGIFPRDGAIIFEVLNVGPGTKVPGDIHYRLYRTAEPDAERPYAMKHYGLAKKTSEAALAESGSVSESVEGVRFDLSGPGTVRICLNDAHEVKEADYANNCREIETGGLYSDLRVLEARMQVARPAGVVTIFGKIRDAISFEFEGWTGRLGEYDEGVIFTVSNLGVRDAPPTQAELRFTVAGEPAGGMTVGVRALGGGETTEIHVMLNRRHNDRDKTLIETYGNGCCNGSVLVDPTNQIVELDESNNKDFFVGALQRDPVRDNR